MEEATHDYCFLALSALGAALAAVVAALVKLSGEVRSIKSRNRRKDES